MSDIIRMARKLYGPAYDQMAAEAGTIKQQYIDGGGNPADVISPERLQTLQRGGGRALMEQPPQQRQDGSIAGPYVPTEMALAMNMIEKRAIPAVAAATKSGVQTVSSGVDADGTGFAIGRAPSGHVVKVRR